MSCSSSRPRKRNEKKLNEVDPARQLSPQPKPQRLEGGSTTPSNKNQIDETKRKIVSLKEKISFQITTNKKFLDNAVFVISQWISKSR